MSYSRLFAFIRGELSCRVFRPRMLRIPPAQLAPDLRIEPLPESRQVARGLHRPLIGRQQMNHQRHFSIRDARSLAHSAEVLETRCEPRRLPGLVMNLCLPPAWQPNPAGRDFVQAL